MKITSIILLVCAIVDTFFNISGSATVSAILYAGSISFFFLSGKMKAIDEKISKNLVEGEVIEKSSMAGATVGFGKEHAGKLVLTNKRLIFKVGALIGGEDVESAENSDKEFDYFLSDINSIEPGLKDLTVVADGKEHVINVGLGKTKSWAEKINNQKNS